MVGKGDKERVALFGARAATAISNYIQFVRTGMERPKDSSLFIGKNGKGLTTRTIQRIVKSANQSIHRQFKLHHMRAVIPVQV